MQANDRLQLEIADQTQQRDVLETQKNEIECKYDDIMKNRMRMKEQECQTNKNFWNSHSSTQTAIVVKYDEIVQVNLIKDEEARREAKRQERQDEQRQVEETLKEINEQTLEGIKEKDQEIAGLQKQLKMTEQ